MFIFSNKSKKGTVTMVLFHDTLINPRIVMFNAETKLPWLVHSTRTGGA